MRCFRHAQHFAVSLTKTSRSGAVLTSGKQMSTKSDPTVDARSRVRLLDESVPMARCCDRVGGERRWGTAAKREQRSARADGAVGPGCVAAQRIPGRDIGRNNVWYWSGTNSRYSGWRRM